MSEGYANNPTSYEAGQTLRAQDVTAQRPSSVNPLQAEVAVANLPYAGGYIQTQAIGSVLPWKTPDGRIVWENPQTTVEGVQRGQGLSGAEPGTQVGTSASQDGTIGKKKKGILPRKDDESTEHVWEILPRSKKGGKGTSLTQDNSGIDVLDDYANLNKEQGNSGNNGKVQRNVDTAGKYDILNNPKIADEIEVNQDAVYGYSPKNGSPLYKFNIDWTDPNEVEFARTERIKYHKKLKIKKAQLDSKVNQLLSQGYSLQEIAKKIVEQRNADRIQSYIDSNNIQGLKAMKERNMLQYGRPEGPTTEQLFNKYGSWEEVIYSSTKTSPAMDVLTGLYDD